MDLIRPDQEWSCGACTFFNRPSYLVCEMCGFQRPQKTGDDFIVTAKRPRSRSTGANGRRMTTKKSKEPIKRYPHPPSHSSDSPDYPRLIREVSVEYEKGSIDLETKRQFQISLVSGTSTERKFVANTLTKLQQGLVEKEKEENDEEEVEIVEPTEDDLNETKDLSHELADLMQQEDLKHAEKALEEQRLEQERARFQYDLLVNMDDDEEKQNASYHVPKVVWRLIFGFLKVSDVLHSGMTISRHVSSACDDLLFKRLVGAILIAEKLPVPVICPSQSWLALYRDMIHKWRSTHNTPDASNINVYCRFRTGETGVPKVRRPTEVLAEVSKERSRIIWEKKAEQKKVALAQKEALRLAAIEARKEKDRDIGIFGRKRPKSPSAKRPKTPPLKNGKKTTKTLAKLPAGEVKMVRRAKTPPGGRLSGLSNRKIKNRPRSPGSNSSGLYMSSRVVVSEELEKELRLPKLPTIKSCVLGTGSKQVYTWLPNYGDRTFVFDGVYDGKHSQRDVYDNVARSICNNALHGFNGTLFVYGQTGSGKTYSMFGDNMYNTVNGKVVRVKHTDASLYGIVPRTCLHILNSLQADKGTVYTFKVSFVEIYLNKVSDLLNKGKRVKLKEQEEGSFSEDAKLVDIHDINSVWEILAKGELQKQMFATAMNSRSSRSHCVFSIHLHQTNVKNPGMVLDCVYRLVDLAGSERVKKSKAVGMRMAEAKDINKSLSTLERCILALSKAMTEKKNKSKSRKSNSDSHIPYRDSELTKLLAESLGGNSQTTMLITCRTDGDQIQETLSTLRFGERTATIQNTVKKKNIIGELQEQLADEDSRRQHLLRSMSPQMLKDAYALWELKHEIEDEMMNEAIRKRNAPARQALTREELKQAMEDAPPRLAILRRRFNAIADMYDRSTQRKFSTLQAIEIKIQKIDQQIHVEQTRVG